MGTWFWGRRFLLVFCIAFTVIAAAQLIQGESPTYAATQALIWATVAAGIFTGSRIYQSRKGMHCALCQDIPQAPAANAKANGAS